MVGKGSPIVDELKPGSHVLDRIPEPEWMARVMAGDRDVLKLLVTRFTVPLQHFAARYLGPTGDPEGVVQEAFVRLWEKRDHWREDGSVKALLFTLTRNAAVDASRRVRREESLLEEGLEKIPSTGPTPSDHAIEAELRRLAEAAVSHLPSRRQEVFRLVREGGLSYREVSETLGISVQTVANLMSLALTDLRSALEPYLHDEPVSRAEAQEESSEEAGLGRASGTD